MGDKHSKQQPTCKACDKTGVGPNGTPISAEQGTGDATRRGSLPLASSTPKESPSTSQRGRASTLPANTKKPDHRKAGKSSGTSKFPIQLRLDHRGSEKSLAPKDKVQKEKETPKPNKKDLDQKDKESARVKDKEKSKTLPATESDSKGSGRKITKTPIGKTPPAKPPPPFKRTDSEKSGKSQSGKSPGVKRSGSTASQKQKPFQFRLDHKGSEKSPAPKEKVQKDKGKESKGKDSTPNKKYIDHSKEAAPETAGKNNDLPARQSINVLDDSPSTKRKIPLGDVTHDNIEDIPQQEENISVEESNLAESAPPVPAKADNSPKDQGVVNGSGVRLRRKPNETSSPKQRPVPIDATVKTIEATVRMRQQKVRKEGDKEETFVTDLELVSRKTVSSEDDAPIAVEQSNLVETSPVQAVVNNPVESGPPRGVQSRDYSDVPVESQESPCQKRKSTRPKSMMSPLDLQGADTSRYERIKAECLKEEKLWEDHDFPAVDSSIFYSMAPPRPFTWKRPKVSTHINAIFIKEVRKKSLVLRASDLDY